MGASDKKYLFQVDGAGPLVGNEKIVAVRDPSGAPKDVLIDIGLLVGSDLNFKGVFDASGGFPSSAGLSAKDYYIVNIPGTISTVPYAVFDRAVWTGAAWNRVAAPPTLIPDASLVRTKLAADIQALMEDFPNTSYDWFVGDGSGRMGAAIDKLGRLCAQYFNIPAGNILMAMLEATLAAKIPSDAWANIEARLFQVMSDNSGYDVQFVDPQGHLGAGIKKDGTLDARIVPGTNSVASDALQADSITRPKTAPEIRRTSLSNPNDIIATFPDGVRNSEATISQITEDSGTGWVRFEPSLTPYLRGPNASGQIVLARRSLGFKIVGRRFMGDFNANAAGVGGIVSKGTFQDATTWPPTGSFVAGDFYEYNGIAARTIGPATISFGDHMVYTGSAWVAQFAPANSSIKGRWWNISAAGYFNGVSYAIGDRIWLVSYEQQGGPIRKRWLKGKPAQGDFFYRGDFDPTAGSLPATPVNGDLWTVSSAAAAGGFTFAVDDTLIYEGGSFWRRASEAISTFATTDYIHLPCHRSANEWEIRRSDKSATRLTVSLAVQRQSTAKGSRDELVVYTDSMGGKLNPSLVTAISPRTMTTRSFGGGTSADVVGMMDYDILTGDPYSGRLHFFWFGQNDGGNPATVWPSVLRAAALCGARDCRLFFGSVLGQRVASWNGARLVIDQQENQYTGLGTDNHVKLNNLYLKYFPQQFIDIRAVLAASASALIPDLQFPGKTERDVADLYGCAPFSYFFDYATVPWTPSTLNFTGYYSTAGLPTGGSDLDYKLRTANGTIGSVIVKVAGVWIEYTALTTFDPTHMSDQHSASGNVALAASVKTSFLDVKGY